MKIASFLVEVRLHTSVFPRPHRVGDLHLAELHVHLKGSYAYFSFHKGKHMFLIFLLLFMCGFRNAYNMVLHKFGEKLYSGLVATMTGHLKDIAQSVEAAQGGSFLEELNRKWKE